jgi:protease-4
VADVNDNAHVKAVLLVVNSPGGDAFNSTVVYDELSKINVPVVGWCDQACASGAVYALSATSVKYIGLHTVSTIIGSVGTIAKYKRVPWDKCPPESCRVEIYKGGPLKQAGAPDHVPADVEMASLQAEVDYLSNVFYAAVDKGRGAHISPAAWARIKLAGSFFGWDGVEVGLADTVMDRAAAVAKAEQLAGVGHLAHTKF